MLLRLLSDKDPAKLQEKAENFARANNVIAAFEPKKRGEMLYFCFEYLEV
jgi:hypothetical protein